MAMPLKNALRCATGESLLAASATGTRAVRQQNQHQRDDQKYTPAGFHLDFLSSLRMN